MTENFITRISKLAFAKSFVLIILIIELLFFHFNPTDLESSVYIVSLFSLIYWILNILYLREQIKLWKKQDRFRFISWYHISFSIIGILVLLATAIISYFLFDNSILTIVALVIFITEVMRLWIIFYYSLYFIAVNSEYILLVKNKIQKIYPHDIAEIYYRNDILIFKLADEKTVFLNFLEINNADKLKKLLAEWILKNGFSEYQEIADMLKNK